MGSETEVSKLPLFSPRISKSRDPQPTDMRLPPLQPVVSIPFHWEESPGKPRPTAAALPEKSRSLELPPRLLSTENTVKIASMSSPTTVIDVRRSGFRTLSFSSPLLGSFRSPGPGLDRKRFSKKVNVEDNESLFEFSSSPSSVFGSNTSTIRRRRILLTFSSATSNFVQAIVRSISKRFPER